MFTEIEEAVVASRLFVTIVAFAAYVPGASVCVSTTRRSDPGAFTTVFPDATVLRIHDASVRKVHGTEIALAFAI
jgi:hypothetical protein